MKPDTISINYWTPTDENDTAIMHGDISMNEKEIASLIVSHQTYQDGWDVKKTGHVEISVSLANSEEFDSINVYSQDRVDIEFAKRCIIENVGIAIALYLDSTER